MPSGIFPVPKFRDVPSRHLDWRPSVAVRIRTRLRRGRLEEELARGADPATSAELSLRAAQLRSRSGRSRLANALAESLGDARRGTPVTIKSRERQRTQVRAAAGEVLALVSRLRDDQPVTARGMAMTARLLSDRSSPLKHGEGHDLPHEIRAARFALNATDVAADDLAAAA
ncbi:MAG: hypothetical protein ACRDL4_06245 [Thermoleophilaceae bacterium]